MQCRLEVLQKHIHWCSSISSEFSVKSDLPDIINQGNPSAVMLHILAFVLGNKSSSYIIMAMSTKTGTEASSVKLPKWLD